MLSPLKKQTNANITYFRFLYYVHCSRVRIRVKSRIHMSRFHIPFPVGRPFIFVRLLRRFPYKLGVSKLPKSDLAQLFCPTMYFCWIWKFKCFFYYYETTNYVRELCHTSEERRNNFILFSTFMSLWTNHESTTACLNHVTCCFLLYFWNFWS